MKNISGDKLVDELIRIALRYELVNAEARGRFQLIKSEIKRRLATIAKMNG